MKRVLLALACVAVICSGSYAVVKLIFQNNQFSENNSNQTTEQSSEIVAADTDQPETLNLELDREQQVSDIQLDSSLTENIDTSIFRAQNSVRDDTSHYIWDEPEVVIDEAEVVSIIPNVSEGKKKYLFELSSENQSLLIDGRLKLTDEIYIDIEHKTGNLYTAVMDGATYSAFKSTNAFNNLVNDNLNKAFVLNSYSDDNQNDWHFNKTKINEAWSFTQGSPDVIVAVIDTGVVNHEDLKNCIVKPYDAVNDESSFPNTTSSSSQELSSHGTFISGIIAAKMNNGIGVSGVAPGVSLMPINVFRWVTTEEGADEAGYYCYDSDLIKAIHYAVDNGADIINISFGTYQKNTLVEDAINYAYNNGVLVVASVGNDNSSATCYPAGYNHVVAVAACDQGDVKASFSNYGDYIDISAPGTQIKGLSLSGYTSYSGTSVSAAIVSSAAALLLSEKPELAPDDVLKVLQESSEDLGLQGTDRIFGYGLLNAESALKSVQKLTIESVELQSNPLNAQERKSNVKLSAIAEYYGMGTPQYQFSVKSSTDDSWQLIQDWSNSFECIWQPNLTGEYNLKTSVKDNDEIMIESSIDAFQIYDIPSQEGVSLSIGLKEPQQVNSEISLSGAATGEGILTSRAEYEFAVKNGSQDWSIVQAWSNKKTCNWIPKSQGEYTIRVYVRTQGRESYDVFADYEGYTIELQKQSKISLKTTPSSICENGDTVTLEIIPDSESETAVNAEYRFWANGQLIQDWDSKLKTTWVPTAEGDYLLEAQARTIGRTGYDVRSELQLTVVRAPLRAEIELSMDKPSGQELGESMVISADLVNVEATSKSQEYEYAFYIRKDNLDFELLRTWNTSNTFTWTPDKTGQYDIKVMLRLKDDNIETKEAYYYDYAVVQTSVIESAEILAEKSAPQEVNQEIIFTARVIGKNDVLKEYKYYFKKDKADWVVLKDWSQMDSVSIVFDEIGMYSIKVQVHEENEPNDCYTEARVEEYQITEIPKQAGVSLKASKASGQEIGTSVDLSAESTSSIQLAQRAEYQFAVKKNSGEWVVISPWNSISKIEWVPEEAAIYSMRVYIRTKGNAEYDAYDEIEGYKIEPKKQPGVTLNADKLSPQELGTIVIFNALPKDEKVSDNIAEYRFMVNEVVVQDWSATSAFSFESQNAETYGITVQIRTQGRSGYDAEASTTFSFSELPKQQAVALNISIPSGQLSIEKILLNAVTSGDKELTDRAEYMFLINDEIVRNWSSNPTFEWNPTQPEIVTVKVRARTQGRSGYDVEAIQQNYEVGIIPLTGVNVSFDKSSPQTLGQTIQFTANASGVHQNNAEYKIQVKKIGDASWITLLDFSAKNSCQWKPSQSGEYQINVYARAQGRIDYDVSKIYSSYIISGKIQVYKDYSYSLGDMTAIQLRNKPVIDRPSDGLSWVTATSSEISYYVSPDNWKSNDQIYQFVKLTSVDGVTESDVNNMLSNKGVLSGHGSDFLQAQCEYNINVAYLVSHALLETGNGASSLAKGVYVDTVDGKAVTPRTVYNMYGIGAYDSDPVRLGAEYAYKQGWFSVKDAIVKGAYWIGCYYIHRDTFKGEPAQDTIYKMRWNPDAIQAQINSGKSISNVNAQHQYATDVAWASKQVSRIKQLLDLCKNPIIEFEIPVY